MWKRCTGYPKILTHGAEVVRRSGHEWRQGLALLVGFGTREEARGHPRSGGHHRARADRARRRHGGRSHLQGLSSRRRFRRHLAGKSRRPAARFRHARQVRLLRRQPCHCHLLRPRRHFRRGDSICLRFFKDEFCGQCTPCRVGCDKAVALLERDDWDGDLLEELAQTMRDASICGLGQAAPNAFITAMEHFSAMSAVGRTWPASRIDTRLPPDTDGHRRDP